MMEQSTYDRIKAYQDGDKKAAEALINENTGLIWSIARRYFGRGTDADDLFQLGCLGFIKAIAGFDTKYGTQFSTYAVPKIAGEIRRFLRDDGSVKVSRSIKERAIAVFNARNRLEQSLGREPTLSELSQETGIEADDIVMCQTATSATESLQKENGEDGFTLESVLGDYGQEDRILENVALKEAILSLPEKERKTVLLRYYRGLTQESTSRIMGISQVQVSRLEKRAMERMRIILS